MQFSDHEHAAPLGIVERGLHHEQLHRLRRVTSQKLDQRLPEGTAGLRTTKIEEIKSKCSLFLYSMKSLYDVDISFNIIFFLFVVKSHKLDKLHTNI